MSLKNRITQKPVPQELEDMLITFTRYAALLHPTDLVSFAAEYFTDLRDHRARAQEEYFRYGSEEFVFNILGEKRKVRRGKVEGERYNPEEEDEDDEEIEINPKTDEERNRIKEQSQEIFLFRVLDADVFSSVIDAMIPLRVEKGQTVIRQGDDADFFYLIDKGDFDIFIKNRSGEEIYFGTHKGEGCFGELALLHNLPRAETIKAATDGYLWAMGRRAFNRLIVKRAFERRQLYMELLNGVPQLKPLTEYEKMQVADALEVKSYSKDDIILHEGDGMYFIMEGKVSVRKTPEDGSEAEEIAQIGKGEYFGELALVEHQPEAATVIALKDVKAAFLEVEAFERLLGPCKDVIERHTETHKKQ